jgi:hypothetical protein
MEHARVMEWGGFVLNDSAPRLNTDVRDVAEWLRDGEEPATGLPGRFLQALGPHRSRLSTPTSTPPPLRSCAGGRIA